MCDLPATSRLWRALHAHVLLTVLPLGGFFSSCFSFSLAVPTHAHEGIEVLEMGPFRWAPATDLGAEVSFATARLDPEFFEAVGSNVEIPPGFYVLPANGPGWEPGNQAMDEEGNVFSIYREPKDHPWGIHLPLDYVRTRVNAGIVLHVDGDPEPKTVRLTPERLRATMGESYWYDCDAIPGRLTVPICVSERRLPP